MRYICSMTIQLHVDTPREMTTQAAEGMLRRRFTVEELEAMVAAGEESEQPRRSAVAMASRPVFSS